MIFDDLLFSGLYREITLGKCDLFLAGIAILGDKITGIAGEHEIFGLPVSTFGNRYRFVGVNEMVRNRITGFLSGFFCLFYNV